MSGSPAMRGGGDEISTLAEAFNTMANSLAKVESQRSEFIANVSHELKTPMTTISGFAEGILDGTIPPEREKESLQIVVSETRRLSRLVRRMLDLARLNALTENTVTAQEQFDLTEVVSQVIISLESKITGRNLDVDVQMPDEKLMVWGTRIPSPRSAIIFWTTRRSLPPPVLLSLSRSQRRMGRLTPPSEIWALRSPRMNCPSSLSDSTRQTTPAPWTGRVWGWGCISSRRFWAT